jgi:hypothetical protein
MPRALGGAPGAPVLPVAPLGSGAPLAAAWAGCLRANAMRVRRGSPLQQEKKIHGRGVRPRSKLSLYLKTKFF